MLPAVLNERVLSFAEAAEACPAIGGRKPALRTVYAWADSGITVGTARVKLECAKLGGRRVTSAEALERFLTALSTGAVPPPVERTPTARRKASDRAMQFLRDEFAKV